MSYGVILKNFHTMRLEAQSLAVGYHKPVICHINMKISIGEFHLVLGANGKGKSTLLRTLCYLQKPLSGSIIWNGLPLTNYSSNEIAQIMAINLSINEYAPFLTVRELFIIRQYVLPVSARQTPENIAEYTGTTTWLKNPLSKLSDGERQKVWLASTIAQNTPLLILDEPTAFMDMAQKIRTFDRLKQLTAQGKSLIVSTHDVEYALPYATHVWIIDRNQNFGEISPTQVSTKWLLDEVY